MLIESNHLKQSITALCEDWGCLMISKEQVFTIIDREEEDVISKCQSMEEFMYGQDMGNPEDGSL